MKFKTMMVFLVLWLVIVPADIHWAWGLTWKDVLLTIALMAWIGFAEKKSRCEKEDLNTTIEKLAQEVATRRFADVMNREN
ncbi:hypothetical protein [Kluyvera ascorbata]